MSPLYITDLDHTLLYSDLSISTYTKDIWNQKSKSSLMGIATARSMSKTQNLIKNIRINIPMILLDGAIIATSEYKPIDIKILDKKTGDAIVEVGEKFGIEPFIIGLKDKGLNETFLYPNRLNTYQKAVIKGYRDDPRMQYNPKNSTLEQNLKIVYFANETLLKSLYKELIGIFGNTIEAKLSPEKYGGGYFLTLLHPKGDKAHALAKVMEYLDRENKDVTVFGDSVNDIGMFKLAGTSIAVSNALDEVKDVADIVLPYSNDEDAVAKYLAKTKSHI